MTIPFALTIFAFLAVTFVGSDDCTVRVWETLTGRCLRTIVLESSVRCVQWCPNKAISLLAVAAGPFIYFINPGVGDKVIMSNTDAILDALPEATEGNFRMAKIIITSAQSLCSLSFCYEHSD